MNKVILIGNLGADVELKKTMAGTSVGNVSIATTERWTDGNGNRQEKTTWHRLVLWGKMAEIFDQYVKKGHKVMVEGKIVNNSYVNAKGQTIYTSEVEVESFEFLEKKA